MSNEAPAGWHPDPSGRHQLRYWDGRLWTEHVATDGVQSRDLLDGAPVATVADELAATPPALVLVSKDGRAELTDATVILEFKGLSGRARRTKRSEIPLSSITGYELVEGPTTYLRLIVRGWSITPDPSKSATAFALPPGAEWQSFVDELVARTNIDEVAVTGDLQREKQAKDAQLRDIRKRNADNPSASFAGAVIRRGRLTYRMVTLDATDATAEATIGAPSSRSTLARMGGGALLFGPVGFVVGAVARKNTTKCFVTIASDKGLIVLEGKAKEYPDAAKFADAVNRSHLEPEYVLD